MEITRVDLEKQLAELENQSQVNFANYHRAQAVILFIKSQIKQLETPVPAEEVAHARNSGSNP